MSVMKIVIMIIVIIVVRDELKKACVYVRARTRVR